MNLLHDIKGYPAAELEFLTEGCDAVIKCREILKWTYVYGYYKDKNMPENRKLLFQQWQSDLEKFCDHLHGLCEKNLDVFMDPNVTDKAPFYHYRGDLTHYYKHTLSFCGNLTTGLAEWEDQ